MKNTVRIDREHHEVYFVDISDFASVKGKKFMSAITDRLMALHPGYSTESAIDVKTVVVENKKWAMITVMAQGVLTELRILHPKKRFYTATSAIVTSANFLHQGVASYGNESIGYSMELQMPVSNPIVGQAESGARDLQLLGKAIIFKRKVDKKIRFAIATIGMVSVIAGLSMCVILGTGKTVVVEPPVAPAIRTVLLPTASNILENVSARVVSAKGHIDQFVYDEKNPAALTVFVRDCPPAVLLQELETLSYLIQIQLSEITYKNEKPYYSVQYALDTNRFHLSQNLTAIDKMFVLADLDEIRNIVTGSNGDMIRQLVNAASDGSFISEIEVQVPGSSIEKTLAEIESYFLASDIRISRLAVSADMSTKVFSLRYSVSNRVPTDESIVGLSDDTACISEAFDCMVRKTAASERKPSAAEVLIGKGYSKVGAIKMENRKTLSYFRNTEGKIITIEE